MKETFLDTSFLIALIRANDENHQAAVRWQNKLNGRFVTTEYVLVELLDATAPKTLRARGLNALQILRGDQNVEIVAASTEWMTEGMRVFEQYADKEWGLTDCISFAVMRRKGIEDALTADRHFEQAGFRALLRL